MDNARRITMALATIAVAFWMATAFGGPAQACPSEDVWKIEQPPPPPPDGGSSWGKEQDDVYPPPPKPPDGGSSWGKSKDIDIEQNGNKDDSDDRPPGGNSWHKAADDDDAPADPNGYGPDGADAAGAGSPAPLPSGNRSQAAPSPSEPDPPPGGGSWGRYKDDVYPPDPPPPPGGGSWGTGNEGFEPPDPPPPPGGGSWGKDNEGFGSPDPPPPPGGGSWNQDPDDADDDDADDDKDVDIETDKGGKSGEAKVVDVVGRAERMVFAGDKRAWRPLKRGDVIDPETIVRTGFGSSAVIALGAGGRLCVGSATKMGFADAGRIHVKYGSVEYKPAPGADAGDAPDIVGPGVTTPAANSPAGPHGDESWRVTRAFRLTRNRPTTTGGTAAGVLGLPDAAGGDAP